VDDDLVIRKLITRWLEAAGYQLTQASNGTEALGAVQLCAPDILITDWEMPGMNGLELCRAVRKLNLPHYVYVLVLTGKTEEGALIASLDAGADNFVQKPVTREELLARIRTGERILDLQNQLRAAALTDLLTGLPSRRAFFDHLYREWHRAQREKRPLSCVMIDIDFFKRINDVYGHAVGDQVLKTVADVVRRGSRRNDIVGRLGGEEFCALLPGCHEAEAAQWAERIRRAVSRTPAIVGELSLSVTASFGVAERADDGTTAEQMLDCADQALMCAKQAGRDRVVCYSDVLAEKSDAGTHSKDLEDPFGRLTAADIMTPVVLSFHEQDSTAAAIEAFTRLRTNSAPVVGGDGSLRGIISEKDLMVAMGSLSGWFRPLGELMRRQVITFSVDTPVRKIFEFLCRVSIRRVVITDRDKPVGTISRGTILRWLRNLAVAKGLLPQESAEATEHAAQEMTDRIEGILSRMVEVLRETAERLQRLLTQPPEELAPHLVGLATGLESLVNDLLGCSRNLREEDIGWSMGIGRLSSGIGGD
jgi:diguanylate cyclase (GGDEF)-like protein